MTNASYQVARDGLYAGPPSEVTQGTAAPTTAGSIEVRLDDTAGWTRNEVERALDRISWYIWDQINGDTSSNVFVI